MRFCATRRAARPWCRCSTLGAGLYQRRFSVLVLAKEDCFTEGFQNAAMTKGNRSKSSRSHLWSFSVSANADGQRLGGSTVSHWRPSLPSFRPRSAAFLKQCDRCWHHKRNFSFPALRPRSGPTSRSSESPFSHVSPFEVQQCNIPSVEARFQSATWQWRVALRKQANHLALLRCCTLEAGLRQIALKHYLNPVEQVAARGFAADADTVGRDTKST